MSISIDAGSEDVARLLAQAAAIHQAVENGPPADGRRAAIASLLEARLLAALAAAEPEMTILKDLAAVLVKLTDPIPASPTRSASAAENEAGLLHQVQEMFYNGREAAP